MVVTHVNNKNFKEEVTNSNIPVIIDFWASWCGPCQMLGPVFEEVSYEYKDKMKFVKVNTEEEENLANRFSIQALPTLIIAKNGEEIDRLVGFHQKDDLKKKIDEIMTKLS
ncbi:MAG: thioredoxin [Candidatus Woesearchaeota archaeon]